jgi:hypothetical protein
LPARISLDPRQLGEVVERHGVVVIILLCSLYRLRMDDSADLPRAPHDGTLPLSPEDRENQEALDLFRSLADFPLRWLILSVSVASSLVI